MSSPEATATSGSVMRIGDDIASSSGVWVGQEGVAREADRRRMWGSTTQGF